jgi:hypothetical protein
LTLYFRQYSSNEGMCWSILLILFSAARKM